MSREIKYRGKRQDNGEWVYGSLVQHSGRTEILVAHSQQILDYDLYVVHPETVGQYINRKDKDGKDIYESYIVDVQDSADGLISEMKAGRYKVVYSQVDCAFILEQLDGKHGIAFDETMSLAVVSNIHDNPELIK